jgi:hypothetical protein
MFHEIRPPGVWLIIHEPDSGEDESRKVTLRIKPSGERSVSVTLLVDRYSTEDSIVRAAAETLRTLGNLQGQLTKEVLLEQFASHAKTWVDPF